MDCRSGSVFRLAISILIVGVAMFAQGAQFVPANDGTADRERIPKRGIIENESAVTDICASYVEAQMMYFRYDHDADGFPAFAQKIRSTPNRRDGLYWAPKSSEDESPMGPKFAAAAISEMQAGGKPQPYFGYYFKILLAQGSDAPGGARDYRVNGRLTTGFALVAWPAEYGISGVHSFLVNHFGDVYAKDLGPHTQRIASGMAAFDPDQSWAKVGAGNDRRR